MKEKKEYFTRFPNEYVQGNISKQFGVSRKFYITYLLIDKYRSYEDYSWITIRKILDFYGYKTFKNKPKSFYEVLDVLEYMINNKMIEVKQPLDSIGYDTGIEIKVIPENFDCKDKFTKITSSQFDNIMMAESSINKENLLLAFLYISSYMGCRSEYDSHPERNPMAFYRSFDGMSKELSMSPKTITQCIEYLTTSTDEKDALFIKSDVGSVFDQNSNKPKNAPNIYVHNESGYEQEIEWALKKMLEVYKKDEFEKKNRKRKN